MEDLTRLYATEAALRLAQREISAEQYVRAHLARIDEREEYVRAFAYLGREQVLAGARDLDSGPVRGPLHGLPLGVKDVFDTYDMPTQGGSQVYIGHQPRTDAACVALARRAGALVIGKTVTTELATFPPGDTRHPLNPAHTPGGSSSGSAAAVADHMVPLATGTQTLGSTVRPASFCGIIGYKPTYNLIPRRGVWNDADTLDTVGLFARSVGDVALFASALLGYRGLLVPDNLTAPRVGLCRTFQWERATPEMKAALDSAGKAVAAAGALVKEVALPGRFADLLQASSIVALWEIAHSLADEYYRNGAKLRRLLHDRCTEGFTVDPENYQRAIALGRECRQMIPDALGDCDVLLAPAATGEAPKGLDWTGDPVFSQVWTFLHVPCVAVPAATGPNGLPLGVQVIGRLDEDARTLHAAHWIHRALEDKARR